MLFAAAACRASAHAFAIDQLAPSVANADLSRGTIDSDALWLSERGGPLSYDGVAGVINRATAMTVGIGLRPHMFRTATASTAAIESGDKPHLGSAILGHKDPRIIGNNYLRVTSFKATKDWAAIVSGYEDE